MKVFDVEQRSQEWHALRLGRITGTRMKKVFSKDKDAIIYDIVSELETGLVEETYTNTSMQWGIDNEENGIKYYELATFQEVHKVGFCVSDKYPFVGLSPDGFVGYNGAVEIKCPSSATHIKYCMNPQALVDEYKYQLLTYFIVNADLEWIDIVSYDPRNRIRRMLIHRVEKIEIDYETQLNRIKEILINHPSYYTYEQN